MHLLILIINAVRIKNIPLPQPLLNILSSMLTKKSCTSYFNMLYLKYVTGMPLYAFLYYVYL